MAAVFIIHAAEDEPFVVDRLIRPLPILGYDGWMSATTLGLVTDDAPALDGAMRSAAAILAVLSHPALASSTIRQQLTAAVKTGRPFVPVRLEPTIGGATSSENGAPLPPSAIEPWLAAAAVDAGDDRVLWTDLVALLPPAPPSDMRPLTINPASIPWPDDVFSRFLAFVVKRHDYNRGQTWIGMLERSLREHPRAYSVASARADLATLRNQRQFVLMRRYAEAVIASGTNDFRVRRQYAQALIELGEFEKALAVLDRLSQDAPESDGEWAEARGLLGRLYKQQYVNNPGAPGAPELLRRAIDAYGAVYRQDREHTWHGINTVSCLRRAARDGVDAPGDPRSTALQLLETVDGREKSGNLYVWDLATRIEADLALDRYDDALETADRYLVHPDMQAFEVSSTYRQFKEVLQLDRDPRAANLMDRLWRAVERHQTAGMPSSMANRSGDDSTETLRPVVIRVADPAWQPQPDLGVDVKTRLGTVVSAMGTEAALKELLRDPLVVSIAESRPVMRQDCHRSVPFINVRDPFAGLAGPYSEKGDRALIAMVDNGIDVLHGAFLDANGQSRIVGIWDQRDPTGPPPAGFDEGTFHTRQQVASYVAQNAAVRAADGAAAAAPPAIALPKGLASRNADGHGTHVASIAAGRAIGAFAGGVAPEAQILVVIPASGGPVGYSFSYVAALKFIDQQATGLGLPVVVNVSQGMNAGAHDGRSPVEAAFDEFSKGGSAAGRVVVKSAGNEGDTRGHAEIEMAAGGADAFEWTCPTPPWFGDRLELWWDSANQYRFCLGDPFGRTSPWVSASQPEVKGQLGTVTYTLQLVRRHVDNGDSRLTLDLGDRALPLPMGTWTIQVESVAIAQPGSIHAWIERREDSRSVFMRNDRQLMTLSIPGTANTVISVAAVDAARPIRVGRFSSYGPTRDARQKPTVCAPGVAVQAARGGTFDQVLEMSGTSMAAPHVTGAIALLLSKAAKEGQRWPNASQIAKTLGQNTLNTSPAWTPSQGWGVVNVAALLNGY